MNSFNAFAFSTYAEYLVKRDIHELLTGERVGTHPLDENYWNEEKLKIDQERQQAIDDFFERKIK